MKNPELQRLLQQPTIWQASRVRRPHSTLSSGYAGLDAQLHHGGWPDNATTELLLSHAGMGELRLLLPGLRQIQLSNRPWLVLIDPPMQPYGSAWARLGLDPANLLLIKPRNAKDLLWSAEQVLQSGCCGAVLTWATALSLDNRQLRRLQQAAHRGQSWHVLLRANRFAAQPSPSALRLQLRNRQDGLLHVDILKQRGGWGGQQLALRLQPDLSQLYWCTPEELLLGADARQNARTPSGKIIPFPAVGA